MVYYCLTLSSCHYHFEILLHFVVEFVVDVGSGRQFGHVEHLGMAHQFHVDVGNEVVHEPGCKTIIINSKMLTKCISNVDISLNEPFDKL